MVVRFESTTEFCELGLRGKQLTRRDGALGTNGSEQAWSFCTVKDAKAELARQIAKKIEAGFVEIKALPGGAVVFPGVSDRALQTFLAKLPELESSSEVAARLARLTTPERQLDLAWSCLAGVDADRSAALVDFLAEQTADDSRARAQIVAELLARRSRWPPATNDEWLRGWPCSLDRLVFNALGAMPDPFVAVEGRLQEPARVGLAFVRARRDQALAPEVRAAVLEALAEKQVAGYGFGGRVRIAWLGADGAEVSREISWEGAGLGEIGKRLWSEEEWCLALGKAARANRWGLVVTVAPGLARLPLDELVEVFTGREIDPFGHDSNADELVASMLLDRADDPAALLALSVELPRRGDVEPVIREYEAERVRQMFGAVAAERYLARGEAIAEHLEEALFKVCPYAPGRLLGCLRSLPRERVLALVRRELLGNEAILGLAAHFDEELFAELLAAGVYLSPKHLAWVGVPGIAALIAACERGPEHLRPSRRLAVLLAMQAAVEQGKELSPAWDHVLVAVGDRDIEPVRAWLIGKLPPERRRLLEAGPC
ncbi:hypothetical protein [Nannocystis radixulma]|uniref:WGR domain-containing protein n=1 Tax=Nannocystis radixulma TaxID=2995305 RepID=A0ABT5B6I5_9BACT|nr:hypothetical protein [Nannocystis radixulma]MDC0669716.1 hypothetical protein [Nannocystis radixulma]